MKNKKNILYVPTFRKDKEEGDKFIEAVDNLEKAFIPYSKQYNLIIKATSNGQKSSIMFYLNEYESIIREIFRDFGRIVVEVEVVEDESKQNIENIKKVFGADKVNITNGGNNNG